MNIFYPKSELLRRYIEYFWVLESAKGDGGDAATEIIPPEAAFDVILSFAGSTVWEYGSRGRIAIGGSFLGGIRKEPVVIHCGGEVRYLAIRFYPRGFFHFLGFPLSEISGRVVEKEWGQVFFCRT